MIAESEINNDEVRDVVIDDGYREISMRAVQPLWTARQ